MSGPFFIRAIWDGDANVYYSDTNVPGLVVEAGTIGEFVAIAEELLPEILEANLGETISPSRPAPSRSPCSDQTANDVLKQAGIAERIR